MLLAKQRKKLRKSVALRISREQNFSPIELMATIIRNVTSAEERRELTKGESVTVTELIRVLEDVRDKSKLVYFTQPDIGGDELLPIVLFDQDGIGVYLSEE